MLIYSCREDSRNVRTMHDKLGSIEDSVLELSPSGFIELDLVIRAIEDIDSKDFLFNDYIKRDKIVLYNKSSDTTT